MSMTKKDLIQLADDIRRVKGTEHEFTPIQLDILGDFCKRSNPNFKRDRWLGYIAGRVGPSGGKIKP
jgi:hypothetical protein